VVGGIKMLEDVKSEPIVGKFAMETDHQCSRSQLVSLLRGAFACPTIATLAESGILGRMLEAPFGLEDFPTVQNTGVLLAIFSYLQALGLLVKVTKAKFELTKQGRTTMRRSGAFLLLASYREYFENLPRLLAGQKQNVSVNRRQNVEGTGSLHSRKFFPVVWEMFQTVFPGCLIDIGCGDGQFLEHACHQWPELRIAAVDLSPVAVEATVARLRRLGRSEVVGIVQDGAQIDQWIRQVPEVIKSSKSLVLSMWFVAHEFSQGDPKVIERFLVQLNLMLPNAEIILGEITAVPPSLLAEHHAISIMPEMLLFHALSPQGVLSWENWREILEEIPYTIAAEHHFDILRTTGGQSVPSSFVWHLKPRLRKAVPSSGFGRAQRNDLLNLGEGNGRLSI
jgi:SAM-dependent methyltransferase